MSSVLLDAGMSLDGFWADADGTSVFPVAEMREAGLIAPLVLRTGAVVMSRTSFDMADDPDWFADNYEYQVPIFVIGGAPPARPPRENGRISFDFAMTFKSALAAARKACGGRDVMIIGEACAAQAAMASGEVDEIYLRIVPRVMGRGIPLFDGSAPDRGYLRSSVTLTEEAIHIHLRARR
ncbi:riboflavin biosynthesis protein RibD [Rhodobacteraceae bacterium 2CG4]|uniref:Riboflavin biosynthesis protein RibD n=1 Tax=Halovulum marinum TaxID=2662447 RepID=A0A6L5Z544_9RHOB|nr:dihydrofolate reductase family protein [Halovulum marinum]MSU91429.1 riboflavin biosynthesis protein RibD [Halovulum marinum]